VGRRRRRQHTAAAAADATAMQQGVCTVESCP
jgi:hypothetical protein